MIREDLAFVAPLPHSMSARLIAPAAPVGGGKTLKTRRARGEILNNPLPVFFERTNILGGLDQF